MRLRSHVVDRCLRLAMDDSARRNALGDAAVTALRDSLALADASNEIRCVLLESAVDGVFSVGMDLAALEGKRPANVWEGYFDLTAYTELLAAMLSFRKPLIAGVDGIAVGGGVDLIAACDLALATERSGFLISQLRKGVFPFTTTALLTRRLGRARVLHWALSGQVYPARKLLELGLVAELTPSLPRDELPPLVRRLLGYDAETLMAGWRACRFGEAEAIAARLREVASLLALNCQAVQARGAAHAGG
jgi:enoyl-CoA hydratase